MVQFIEILKGKRIINIEEILSVEKDDVDQEATILLRNGDRICTGIKYSKIKEWLNPHTSYVD